MPRLGPCPRCPLHRGLAGACSMPGAAPEARLQPRVNPQGVGVPAGSWSTRPLPRSHPRHPNPVVGPCKAPGAQRHCPQPWLPPSRALGPSACSSDIRPAGSRLHVAPPVAFAIQTQPSTFLPRAKAQRACGLCPLQLGASPRGPRHQLLPTGPEGRLTFPATGQQLREHEQSPQCARHKRPFLPPQASAHSSQPGFP